MLCVEWHLKMSLLWTGLAKILFQRYSCQHQQGNVWTSPCFIATQNVFLWAPLCSISSTAIVLSLQGYKIQSNGTRRRHVFRLKIEQGRKNQNTKGCVCVGVLLQITVRRQSRKFSLKTQCKLHFLFLSGRILHLRKVNYFLLGLDSN